MQCGEASNQKINQSATDEGSREQQNRHTPPPSKLRGPVTKPIRGVSWPRRQTEGCTSSCGGSGDEFVFGDGECKEGDRANVSSAVEEVSWHAGVKFSTLFGGEWFEPTSDEISPVFTEHMGKSAKYEVDTVVSWPFLQRMPVTRGAGGRSPPSPFFALLGKMCWT